MKAKYQGELTFGMIEPAAGLNRALDMRRSDIISEISKSRMRGRGGAGFPTGTKWNLAAAAISERKYVVCNADEGEPGTFKDRVILQEYADLVLDGMTIAGKAIGAEEGIIYLRGEYAYLRSHLEEVVEARRNKGLLGAITRGSTPITFDIRIQMGSGAYVCGEETALIESLEGYRGEPRNRPPYPVDTGFNNFPTIVNNVETFAWAACILAKGADWFTQVGTDKSTGYKLFSVSGDVEKAGVYEFPMGITIDDLLKEVGGTGAKAVQIGGASGHCVPAADFKRVMAYEDISTGGSVIVFGPDRDMLSVACNFLAFFVEESCGQCTPCRIGNVKLLDGLKKLQAGTCSMTYLKELISLGETMQIASKCGLGQSSPNAFLSIVKNFKEELMGRVSE
ncbi:SLBB domain-containing protein [bacterium]|nr:SLBB domain-containing protein [candidate division CSSED10-310 bacterium]